jgi:hypothetical protein
MVNMGRKHMVRRILGHRLQLTLLTLGVFSLGAFAIGFLTHYSISRVIAEENLIHGCIRKYTGLLRIIEPTEKCDKHETSLTWNAQGPPGPAGSPGELAHPFICIDCASDIGHRLAGKNLSGGYINRSEFNENNFSNANLSDTFIAVTNMWKCNFTNVNFKNAVFNVVDLKGSNFTGADLTNVTWVNSTCPDGTNSNNNGNTCTGHLTP